MTRRTETDDRLDEVLAEIERARHEPTWVPEPERAPRRLIGPPDALEGARWTPSRPAVLVIVALALLAASVLGVRFMLARPSASEAAPGAAAPSSARVMGAAQIAGARSAGAGAADVSSGASGAAAPGASTPSPTSLSIHVVGAVSRPGVVTVKPGGRVEDAVRAAGGLKGADPTAINLARPLTDGEQIHVPRPGEKVVETAPGGAVGAGAPGSSAAAAAVAPGAGSATGGLVNLNTADAAALDALPGVGPVLAQRIIEWRTTNGRFSSVDELGEVSGIGDKALERLRPKVTV